MKPKDVDCLEYRRFPESLIFREEDREKRIIEGYFAKFDRWFHGQFFKEKIAPGAFARTLKEHDIRALWNHNDSFPLARTGNNSLKLIEDDKGLWGQIDVPDTNAGRDALTLVRSGVVTGASFGFEVKKEDWNEDFTERTLTQVKLWEVSPVVFPAYSTTNISARSLVPFGRPVGSVLERLVERSRSGKMTVDEREMFDAILAGNQSALEERQDPPEPVPAALETVIRQAFAEEFGLKPEPEEAERADSNRLAEARCLVMFHNLEGLGLARRAGTSQLRRNDGQIRGH